MDICIPTDQKCNIHLSMFTVMISTQKLVVSEGIRFQVYNCNTHPSIVSVMYLWSAKSLFSNVTTLHPE